MIERRVLSCWQPHATLCVAKNPDTGRAWKEVETRHFRPEQMVRGIQLPIPIVIHATLRWNGEMASMLRKAPFASCLRNVGYSIEDPKRAKGQVRDLSSRRFLPLGALIGIATIVEVHPVETFVEQAALFFPDGDEAYDIELALGNYTPGRFGWELEDIHEFEEPIPFKGRQDVLWTLPPEQQEMVERAPLRADDRR